MPTKQTISKPRNQSINQSINQLTPQSIGQSIKQLINLSTNQSINQSLHSTTRSINQHSGQRGAITILLFQINTDTHHYKRHLLSSLTASKLTLTLTLYTTGEKETATGYWCVQYVEERTFSKPKNGDGVRVGSFRHVTDHILNTI